MANKSEAYGFIYKNDRKELCYFGAPNPKNRGFKEMNILEFLFPEKRTEESRKKHKELAEKTLISLGGDFSKNIDIAIKEFEESLKKINAKH